MKWTSEDKALEAFRNARTGNTILNMERTINSIGTKIEDLGIKNPEVLDDDNYYNIIEDETLEFAVVVVDGVAPTKAEDGVYYRYVGPRDSKNRDFCSKMLNRTQDRLLTREDISRLRNPGFGQNGSNNYDILRWAGGGRLINGKTSCRHKFIRYKVVDGVIEKTRIQPKSGN